MEEEKKEQVGEEKKEEEPKKEEIPEGYYITETPSEYVRVIALGKEQVPADELLVKLANAVKKAGLMD